LHGAILENEALLTKTVQKMNEHVQSGLRVAFSNIKADICSLMKDKDCQISH